jgi:hypothetical protein
MFLWLFSKVQTKLDVCLLLHMNKEKHEICTLLGYYVASCGNCLPTFWDYISVPSSWVKSPIRKERKPATYNIHSIWKVRAG